MTSTLSSPSSSSRSSVQRDLPVEASVCRSVTLLVSPREVCVGCVLVRRAGCWACRTVVKRETWARARAEERVPMRRVRCGEVEVEVEVEGEEDDAEVVAGWAAIARLEGISRTGL